MSHAKFKSPSINIDRYFQLSSGGREGESKGDVELGICPKGKGRAKNLFTGWASFTEENIVRLEWNFGMRQNKAKVMFRTYNEDLRNNILTGSRYQ